LRLPTVKLTHKVALIVVVPLAFALIFVSLLIVNLKQAEQDIEAEAHAEEILIQVNEAIRDAMGACGGMLILRMYHEPKVLHDTTIVIQKLKHDRDLLAESAEKYPEEKVDIQEFVRRIDQGSSMFRQVLEMTEESESLGTLRVMGQMKTFSEVLNFEGNKLAEKMSEQGKMFRQKRKEDRMRIELLIQMFTGIGFVLSLAIGYNLMNTVFKRLAILMGNTVNIGLGKPLAEPLAGDDELAQLDGVMHLMSEDLHESRVNERALIDNAANIICSLDRGLRIAQINPAVERILGYEADQLLGTSLSSIVHEDEKSNAYEHLKALSSANPQTAFEAKILTKSGSYKEMDWVARWSQQDKSIFCVAHDITERKEAERLKQELFAMVSHDLRSPLTSISMTLEMLDDGILGSLNERGAKLAGSANASIKSLMILINDLLESERMAHLGMVLDYEQADLDKIVQQAIDYVTPEANSKKLDLTIEGQCSSAQLDPEKIRRVLVNLLNNAIKFSSKGTTITTVLSQVPGGLNGSDAIEVRVCDEGPGIPPDKQALVFEKFKQAGRRDEGEKKGSGLGLSICKAIVEAHGGIIGVTSEPNTPGSVFWFKLPIAPP
jgi:PAS domain S-box-containing protein